MESLSTGADCAQKMTRNAPIDASGTALTMSPSFKLPYSSPPFQASGKLGGLNLKRQFETVLGAMAEADAGMGPVRPPAFQACKRKGHALRSCVDDGLRAVLRRKSLLWRCSDRPSEPGGRRPPGPVCDSGKALSPGRRCPLALLRRAGPAPLCEPGPVRPGVNQPSPLETFQDQSHSRRGWSPPGSKRPSIAELRKFRKKIRT